MKITLLKIIPLLSLASATSSFAAITMIDTGSFATGTDATSYTITAANIGGALNFTGASKLVVTIGSETSTNSAGLTPTTVTYGGQTLLLATTDVGNNGRASVYYLDLGAAFVGTDFVISYSAAQNGVGLGAYTLGGTKVGFENAFTSGSTSTVGVTTVTDGAFVVTSFARNNVDWLEGASGPANGAQAPLTELYRSDATAGDSNWSAASAYAQLGDAGSQDLTFFENNGTGRIVAVTFAVPEPSSAMLGGLGVLFLLRRRRA